MSNDDFIKKGRERFLQTIEDRRVIAKESRTLAEQMNGWGAPASVVEALLRSAEDADRVADELEAKGEGWIVLP